MPKSKIKSFSPLMRGEKQETYSGPSGILYKQSIEFANSDTGSSLTKSPKAPYKIGVEYEYEKKTSGQYTNFSKVKEVNKGSFGSGGGYNDPSKIQKAAFSVCLSASVTIIDHFDFLRDNNNIIHLGMILKDWVLKTPIKSRDEFSLRWNTVLRAADIYFPGDDEISIIMESASPIITLSAEIELICEIYQKVVDELEINNTY